MSVNDPILRPATGQTFLGPEQRAEAWERLGSEQFDVVVMRPFRIVTVVVLGDRVVERFFDGRLVRPPTVGGPGGANRNGATSGLTTGRAA